MPWRLNFEAVEKFILQQANQIENLSYRPQP
jgi:hypothetical protein